MGKKKKDESKVLYLRVPQTLLDGLEELRKKREERDKGVEITTSDVARSILWKAIMQ